MENNELNSSIDNNKGVIFVCKYCGELFWSFEERDEHKANCEHKKVIKLSRQV